MELEKEHGLLYNSDIKRERYVTPGMLDNSYFF